MCSSGRLALAQDRYEPDNTFVTASNIVVDASQTNRTIHVTNDLDYVCFDADVKNAYGVGMTNIYLGSDGQSLAVLTLFDTNGTTVLNAGTNFTDVAVTQIWLSLLTTNAGRYYVRAESLDAVATGSYDLVLNDYGTGDAYEMDNSPNTASNFVVGVSQPHSLHWTGDSDYSKFTNMANHLYLIEVTNCAPTVSIILYDTDGTNVLKADENWEGNASFEYVLVPTGTYYVSVSRYGASTGTYFLAITDMGVSEGDMYELDNSAATASNITVGVSQTNRSIHWVGDVDYAAIPFTNAHRYVIAATNVGADLNIVLSLYGTNGTTELYSMNLGGIGEDEYLTNVCTFSGTYFIEMRSSAGASTGAYSLAVMDIGSLAGDSYEVDDAIGQAKVITPGTPQTNRTIHLAADVDYLQFTAQAERYYTIETYALDWGLDTWIYLYDSTGTNLLASNNNGAGGASWLEYKIQAAGTYYIKVNADNAESVGYYSIRLTDTRIREKNWDSLGNLSSPAIGHDGLIYVGSYDNDSNMYAFAAGGTTSKVWSTGSSIRSSPAIASNGSVYIGSDDDRFYCFGTNGDTNWISGTTSGDIIGSPALSFDGRIYIGSEAVRFLSFNPDGTTNWTKVNLPGAVRVSPAIGTNGTVYIGCDATNFYSFNPNGTTNWVARVPSAFRSSAAIASNGEIYVASFAGNLYAFNPTNGATNHVWTTGKYIEDSSPVIGANGDIYIGAYSGTTNGALYSFNQDGGTNWSVQFTNKITSTPLIGCDGTVYIGTWGRDFYAFNPDGSTNFMTALNYATNINDDANYLITASPVMDTNGILYVAAASHLFAIYGTSYGIGGLADSSWPMFLHDARHTGSLPPPAPAGVSASDGSFTGQVRIAWSATTNTANYEIWRSTNGNSANASCIGVSAQSPCDDTSATPATVYYYWVKAANNSGSSPFSASDSGWRMIAAPTDVAASDGAYTTMVQVAWSSTPGAVSYGVWRNTTSDTGSASNLTEIAETNYNDTTAVMNITYYYWIQARGANGTNSAFSLPDTGWRAAPVIGAPSAPTGVTASDGAYVDKVRLTWMGVTQATAYSVFRSTSSSTSDATVIASSTTTNYNDTSATVGQLFYYWVKATNANGASAFSSSDTGWRGAISAGMCADYDGDRKADPAVYDEATGTWRIKLSGTGYSLLVTTFYGLGGTGLVSVAADYDGDKKADPAVYQELTGTWIVLPSSLEYARFVLSQTLGGPGYSGMPADYDGDAKADPGVYQRERGDWKVLLSSLSYNSVEVLGLLGGTGYRAVAADYDGDGIADPAVYGESTGIWSFLLSSVDYWKYDSSVYGWSLGGAGYIPVPADYDGDGKADPAVRSETGNEWIVMLSSGGYTPVPLTIPFE